MRNEASDFRHFIGPKFSVCDTAQKFSKVSLSKCVSQVIDDILAATDEKSDSIINDVPTEMFVSTNKGILASVLSCLLITMVMNNRNNAIHISAKTVGNITLMHIRNSYAEIIDHIAGSMPKIEILTETIGGCVTISNDFVYGLTLSFTFINH